MNNKYLYYFEIKYDGCKDFEEGGFIYASNWNEAINILIENYGCDIVSINLETLDDTKLFFPIEIARKFKEVI